MTTTTAPTVRREKAEALKARVDAARKAIARQDYTVPEVAAILGVNRNSAYDAVKRGELGHYKIGRNIRVTQAHLDVFRAGTGEGEQI
ncbi:helix-turn-helix domain-containing protein [Agrococcus casei]|uniref:helix-turn-helix domain-containing protein n=1 Tax=Agrococcus casei TaxID=343512 RepID=UPI003F8F77EC